MTTARLRHLSEDSPGAHDLTPAQREALLLAYREGYFESPREIDQATLDDRIGISRQALAARLRRGYRNLVASTLVTGDESPSEGVVEAVATASGLDPVPIGHDERGVEMAFGYHDYEVTADGTGRVSLARLEPAGGGAD